MVELFVKIVNGFKRFTILAKKLHYNRDLNEEIKMN